MPVQQPATADFAVAPFITVDHPKYADAVERLVAAALGGRRGSVLSGSGSRRKRVLVRGLTVREAELRIR